MFRYARPRDEKNSYAEDLGKSVTTNFSPYQSISCITTRTNIDSLINIQRSVILDNRSRLKVLVESRVFLFLETLISIISKGRKSKAENLKQ